MSRVRYYRVHYTDDNGLIVIDDTLYIEKRIDKKNREYYMQVEDYTHYNGNYFQHRLRKKIALESIRARRFVTITKGLEHDNTISNT